MKTTHLATAGVILLLGLASATAALKATEPESGNVSPVNANYTELRGIAEDLWGNRIDLADYCRGLTLVQPFSPANCGYCLVDGELVKRNYLERNQVLGGYSFHQCLFNPQLDVYTFLKHYREELVPVLTFPIKLHAYHRDGFPFLLAFRDGKQVYQGVLAPYDLVFEKLRREFWPDQDASLVLTSPAHLGTVNCLRAALVQVVSDGDEPRYQRSLGFATRVNESTRQRSMLSRLRGDPVPSDVEVKYESALTEDDLPKNLEFGGVTGQFRFQALENQNVPIQIGATTIEIGPYTFPKSDVGLDVFFPNPRHHERYVSLALVGENVKRRYGENWVDFVVFRDSADGASSEVLLHGSFDKTDPQAWRFSEKLAFARPGLKCKEGWCPAPVEVTPEPEKHAHTMTVSPPATSPHGKVRTLGNAACRFPKLAVGPRGSCWVVWEERGDILLCSLSGDEANKAIVVEDGAPDSFSPAIASDGSLLWVFYLSNRDGFYRLYGRYWDGRQLSEEILLSEKQPCDAVTPAAVGDRQGRVVVAWTDWKANFRYLRYRVIEDRTLGPIQTVRILQTEETGGYVNAWFPSLTFDATGQVWAAWNQHYPATLGVCAGNLRDAVSSVTRLPGDGQEEEKGGYPTIVVDAGGRRWVFWESFGWDVAGGKPQKVLASYYDQAKASWTLPYTLSRREQTVLNQTPRAVVDRDGVVWVTWSGRPSADDIDQPWGIYLSRFTGDDWSAPMLVSAEGESSRAPDIAVGDDNRVWITWHAGTGDAMKTKVLECERDGDTR